MNEEYFKNFNLWNKEKMKLNAKTLSVDFFFLEREIWWAVVGINVGEEIDGKNEHFERPVLIVKKVNENFLHAIPITSTFNTGAGFYPITYKNKAYTLLILQMRSMSAKRLLRPIFRLDEDDFMKIVDLAAQFLFSRQNETPVSGGISTDITGKSDDTGITVI